MNILITGSEASGKSEYAEKIAVEKAHSEGLELIYIATLDKNSGGDTQKRIEKHRKMRKDKGFITIEQPKNLENIVLPKKNCVVLLEDLGNLCANEVFCNPASAVAAERNSAHPNYASRGKKRSAAQEAAILSASVPIFADSLARKIAGSLEVIASQAAHFITVSPDVFSGADENDSTELHIFMQTFASAAASWAEKCERVIQIVAGIPVSIK